MKHLLIVALTLLLSPAVRAENKLLVTKITSNGDDANGVIYALPKTVVGVDLTVKKVSVKAGKFASETHKFFDLKPADDYPTCDSVSFSADSAAFKSRQVADTDEVYWVQLKSEWLKDHHFNLEIAEDGTLTKGEITITNRRVDFFLSILGAVASIAGKFIGAAVPLKTLTVADQKTECDQVITEAAHKPDEAANAPEGARHAFCEIVKLSRRRQDIVLDVTPVAGGTAAMLQDIDRQLKKLFADNFTGSKAEGTWTTRFEDLPKPGSAPQPVTLLTFTAECGVRRPGAAWIDTRIADGFSENGCKATDRTEHTISLIYQSPKAGSLHSRFITSEPAEHSFAFRIPAAYELRINDAHTEKTSGGDVNRDVARGVVGVAQLGVVGYLPAVVGGKKSAVTVTLHASGALKTVDIGGEAQGGIAEAAGTAVSSLVDGELARRKALKDETDEVAVAEKKQKLLEAQVAARRAQCILDEKCPLNPE